ncbi:MAG: hypothetical protein J6V33_03095 [Bacteroidales bacterium]|nr:hypothetical protein [Bacteroidales bacterium]
MDMDKFIELSPKLYGIGMEIALNYKNELRRKNAVASGDLINFQWDITPSENGLKLQFFLPEYWRYIEFGRRKTVNHGDGKLQEKILRWIDEKGITPKDGISKKSLAFLITRKIHREGFKGRNCLQNALNDSKALEQQFIDIVAAIYAKEVKDMIVQLKTE